MNGREGAAAAMLAVAFALLLVAIPMERRPARPLARPPAAGAARLLFGLRLDPNREPAAALEALPGIGPARARAIVAGRPYCRVAELTRVPGIGPVTLSRIADRLEVRTGDCAQHQGD
ncbi:MAG: helix-hairpin-helix domain-containing protein [Myxococcota bacterium]